MSEHVWTKTQVIEALAATYFATAKAGADMFRVTEAVESLRTALSETPSPLLILDVLDDRVAKSYGLPEQDAIVDLRASYIEALAKSYSSAVRNAYAQSAESGWETFVTAYAELGTGWRFDLGARLAWETFPHPEGKESDCMLLARAAVYAVEDRWYETYPMFRLLGSQAFLPPAQAARFVAMQGLIELYFLFRNEHARALIERALEQAPIDAVTVSSQGEYLLSRDDIGEARVRFQRALEIDPHHVQAYCLLGDCSLAEDDLVPAEKWYEHALKQRPGDVSPYLRICRLFARREGSAVADPIPDAEARLMVIEPRSVYGFDLDAANAYQTRRDFDRAHQWYARAISHNPERMGAHNLQGHLFLEQRRFEEARRSFQKAIDAAPKAIDGYWGLARVEDQVEAWSAAEHWYTESLPWRPEWEGRIRANIARTRIKQGKLAEAEEEVRKAARIDPRDAEVLAELEPLAALAQGDHGLEAGLQFNRALRETLGESYEARYRTQMSALLGAAGDHAGAADALFDAVAADPGNPAHYLTLAQKLREAEDWDRGRLLWTTAPEPVQADPKFRAEVALLRNDEANVRFGAGDYRAAVALFEEAVTLSPSDPVLYSNLALGREYDRSEPDSVKRLSGVRAALSEALRLNPAAVQYSNRLSAVEQLLEIVPLYGDFGLERLPVVTPLAMEVASDLLPFVEASDSPAATPVTMSGVRDRIFERYGVRLPLVRVRGNDSDMPAGSYLIMLMEVPRVMGQLSTGKRFCAGPVDGIEALKIPFDPGAGPGHEPGAWIDVADGEAVTRAGLELWGLFEYAVRHLEKVMERNLSSFVGVNETYERLLDECSDLLPGVEGSAGGLARFAGVLRALVAEGVSILELRLLGERYLDLNERGAGEVEIVEELRSLPEIAQALPGNRAGTSFVEMGSDFERGILEDVHRDGSHAMLAMLPEKCQEALSEVRQRLGDRSGERLALLVESAAVRPFVRKLIELEWPDVPVLARRELITEAARATETQSREAIRGESG